MTHPTNVPYDEQPSPWPSRPLTDEGARGWVADVRAGRIMCWNGPEIADWIEKALAKKQM